MVDGELDGVRGRGYVVTFLVLTVELQRVDADQVRILSFMHVNLIR